MRANFVLSGVVAGIRRNLSMTVALVLSTAIALGFVGAALLADTEISKFRHTYEGKLNVSIYLCSTVSTPPVAPCLHKVTPAEQAALVTAFNSDPMVKSTTYIDQDQAYQLAKQQLTADEVRFLQPGVFPASYIVKLRDISKDYDSFAAKYATFAGVDQVSNQIDTVRTLLNIIDSVRLFSLVIALVVLAASVMLIANTIQVAAAQRKNETSIMRLVGASRWMTELPFMIETVIAAAVGGIIAILGIGVGEQYVLNGVFSGPTKRGVIPNLDINDVLKAGGIGLIVGIVLSAATAFATLRLRVRL
jgi:cell division transport system permease protein